MVQDCAKGIPKVYRAVYRGCTVRPLWPVRSVPLLVRGPPVREVRAGGACGGLLPDGLSVSRFAWERPS